VYAVYAAVKERNEGDSVILYSAVVLVVAAAAVVLVVAAVVPVPAAVVTGIYQYFYSFLRQVCF
jgi:hypothetical protein